MWRAIWIIALAAFPSIAASQAADNPYPGVAAAYLVRVDGRTLWSGEADRRLPPASLTKVMTALLVLQRGNLDKITTVSARAAAAGGTRLRLRAGGRFKVHDLLVAALVRSANDACLVLAEWHSGNEMRFVETMNAHARALDLRNTHFANACGFDDDDHYSTASDLARLAEIALEDARFAEIVARPEAAIRTTDGSRTYRMTSTNALLGRLPGAAGVKSGFTRRAGSCIIAFARREGRSVLVVMLGAENRWWDAHSLAERAFRAGTQ